MASPRRYTVDGWELQLGTNHMGHSILTTGLHGALAQGGGARVVSVSSAGRYFEDGNEAVPSVPGVRFGHAPWAYDEVGAARLWDTSLDLIA